MFQHIPSPNMHINRTHSQSTSFRPFYTSIPTSQHIHDWLRWEYLSWQPNLLNFSSMPLTNCKIEEPQPIGHIVQHIHPTQKLDPEFRSIKETKEEQQPRTQEEDVKVTIQKRAIYLSRKVNTTQEQRDELKQYRLMRKEGYLNKKAKRTFEKKIVYTTRKRVADRRIRFKGKFINEYQARQLLGLSGSEYTFQELKAKMSELKTHS